MARKGKRIKLKAVDFFCCAGGVTYGFRRAGIRVLGGIDIDGRNKTTYERNNTGSKFIEADISKLKFIDLKRSLKIKRNMDDLIFVGCSPCQYYTTIQTNKKRSSKGKLLLEEFQRFVKHFLPGYVFVENVPGLETKKGSPLSKFKEFLKDAGYDFDDNVVNAADYNVPQNRKRYVLVASRVKSGIRVPSSKPSQPKTVRGTIGNLAAIPAGHRDKKAMKHWSAELQEVNFERIRNTSHDGGTRLEWKDIPDLQLACYVGKDSTFSDVYGRMHWDLPAPTITTKFHSISNGRFGHPEQDRGISLREGALLQSFPKKYRFYSDSLVIVARMIGNAVPPYLAKAIASSIIRHYAK